MTGSAYRHWPPGFHRTAEGRWLDEGGAEIKDPQVKARLRSLAIPPAWEHVWAAEDPQARVQARGIDSRGRVQYRYSEDATRQAALDRFSHMMDFSAKLPTLRSAVNAELRRRPHAPDAAQVTGLVVKFLDLGLFRVGTDRYARDNHTYGLTTLQPHHVSVDHPEITFDFIGKEHLRQVHTVSDRLAATVTRRLLDHSSDEHTFLFRSCQPPEQHVDSASVNTYIHGVCGAAASAKVFRTWGATVIAAAVGAGAEFALAKQHKDPSLTAYEAAAFVLGNTPSMARHSYVHPRAWSVGQTDEIRAEVASAADRAGTNAADVLFTDERLQESVRLALSAGE